MTLFSQSYPNVIRAFSGKNANLSIIPTLNKYFFSSKHCIYFPVLLKMFIADFRSLLLITTT